LRRGYDATRHGVSLRGSGTERNLTQLSIFD
jgi:hypothetical protein